MASSHVFSSFGVALRLILAFYTALAAAVVAQEPLLEKPAYKLGDAIPVTCLNRTLYVLHCSIALQS